MSTAAKAVLAVALVAVVTAFTVYSGIVDVAATTPHWRVTRWMLSVTMENSVRRRARAVQVPADLDDGERIRRAASAYDEMCADCHAKPGVEADVLAKGLLPEPPQLADEAGDWSAAEQFWIVKNGIRMSGMPAFGPTHGDDEIWDVVAFLRALPLLSPEEYRALVAAPARRHEHDHAP